MVKFKFERNHMPSYNQIRSACGITAVLMLIRPNKDSFISFILYKIGKKLVESYSSLGALIKDKNSMHQVALAYLLLKLVTYGPQVKDYSRAIPMSDNV